MKHILFYHSLKNRLANFFGIIIIAALFISGCTKGFLDVSPQGIKKASNFWQTPDDAYQSVNAIYGNLHSAGMVGITAVAIESLGSDEADPGAKQNDIPEMYNFDNFSVTPTNQFIGSFWSALYQEINLCNQVIDHVDTMKSVSNTLKTQYIGEAKFVRALSYFRLVRAYGAVPLRLHLPTADEVNIPKSPVNTVWAAIETDLTDATTALPANYTVATDKGRVTKWAALSLHAKVAMYQNKWADVKTYTDLVIQSNNYVLFSDFYRLFRLQNELSTESVFEIQCDLIQGAENGVGFPWSQFSESQMPENMHGYGWNSPSLVLSNAYTNLDKRKNTTIMYIGTTTPDGDFVDPNGNNQPRYNMKNYVPLSNYISGYPVGSQQNIRVIRYADVLLMNAEANNEQNSNPTALISLNKVRARAGLSDITETDKVKLRTIIWDERKLELAMENDRYFDVIRQGRAAAIFGVKGWKASKNEVWPIPYNEIILSGGRLTQNQGY